MAYVTTLTSLAEEIRANRIVAGVRIPHPVWQSYARAEKELEVRAAVTRRALEVPTESVEGPSVFRVDHRGPLMAPDPMRLVRQVHRVDSIAFGSGTALDNRRLSVDRQALVDLVLSDDRPTHCNVELVSLAKTRASCTSATRSSRSGGSADRPSRLEVNAQPVGDGVTHRLAGVGVTTCCELPWRKTGGIQIPRENIAEMRGQLAELSPLGAIHNIILEVVLRDGLPDESAIGPYR